MNSPAAASENIPSALAESSASSTHTPILPSRDTQSFELEDAESSPSDDGCDAATHEEKLALLITLLQTDTGVPIPGFAPFNSDSMSQVCPNDDVDADELVSTIRAIYRVAPHAFICAESASSDSVADGSPYENISEDSGVEAGESETYSTYSNSTDSDSRPRIFRVAHQGPTAPRVQAWRNTVSSPFLSPSTITATSILTKHSSQPLPRPPAPEDTTNDSDYLFIKGDPSNPPGWNIINDNHELHGMILFPHPPGYRRAGPRGHERPNKRGRLL